MTDLPTGLTIPSRLGTTVARVDGRTVGHLFPRPETCTGGVVRASVVAFLVDAVSGLEVDTDPDAWAFTSDLSLRLPTLPAPSRIDALETTLRQGRRSVTSAVSLTTGDGAAFGSSVIGFARVPRRDTDPEKYVIDVEALGELWARIPTIDGPLREVVGVRSIDVSTGETEVPVRADLLNPAGALQGAMVALGVEAAAEDLAGHGLGRPHVVTELDLRFLGQGRVGPVRSCARFVGAPADGSVEVELHDVGQGDKPVAVGYARVRPALDG